MSEDRELFCRESGGSECCIQCGKVLEWDQYEAFPHKWCCNISYNLRPTAYEFSATDCRERLGPVQETYELFLARLLGAK
jgi:hypothetical protein